VKRIVLLVFLFLVVSVPNCLASEGATTKEETYKNTGEDINVQFIRGNEVFNITISPKILDEQQTTFLITSNEETNNDDNDDLMGTLMKTLKFVTRTICYEF